MLRRIVRWLLGIPRPEDLELRRHMMAERDWATTAAQAEASRSNLAGGKGSGSHPRDWPNLLP